MLQEFNMTVTNQTLGTSELKRSMLELRAARRGAEEAETQPGPSPALLRRA